MRKIFVMSLMTLAFLAFVSAPAFAQCAQTGNKEVKTTQTAGGTDIKPAHCNEMKDCARTCTEPCEGHQGKCMMIDMSIKGMTCGGCETTIKTALETVPGVLKVNNISYKNGLAQVCFDPDKAKMDNMTKAVVDKGYQVEIIPAVAKTTEVTGEVKAVEAKAGCDLPCPSKATCAKGGTTTKKAEGDGTK